MTKREEVVQPFVTTRSCSYQEHADRIKIMIAEGLHDGQRWKPEAHNRYAELEQALTLSGGVAGATSRLPVPLTDGGLPSRSSTPANQEYYNQFSIELGHCWEEIPISVQDALISREIRVRELEEAFREFLSHDGGEGSQDYNSSIYLYARRKALQLTGLALNSKGEKG